MYIAIAIATALKLYALLRVVVCIEIIHYLKNKLHRERECERVSHQAMYQTEIEAKKRLNKMLNIQI